MSPIIIITDTEEPGAFDSESKMAVIILDTTFVYRMDVLTTELKNNHSDFSELRLWGSYAGYYNDISSDQLLDALMQIANTNPDKIEPSKVDEIRTFYQDNGSFKWPADLEFNLRDLLNMTAEDYDKELSDEEPEPMSVDIEEIVAENGNFRCSAYSGDQQIYSRNIPYSWVLDKVAV